MKLNCVKWECLDLRNELVCVHMKFAAVLPFQSRNSGVFGLNKLVKVMQQLR